MYMDDAIRATIGIMEAPSEQIKIRTSYNLSALSFSPKQIGDEIKSHIKNFKITYSPDNRDRLAESWPQSINDDHARNDWGWNPNFNLSQMVSDIILNLNKIYKRRIKFKCKI